MRLSFCGLGAIGVPMAAHLAKQGALTVWNRTAERATEFAASHGARVARTPREAATAAEAVITCLPTSREVDLLLGGPDGLEAGLEPGSLLIDCTSGDPGTSRAIAERLRRRGVGFTDAPVSGGVSGAVAGTLTVMVGGDPASFARARPILSAFGKRIEHLGPVGAGHAMKAVNNAILAVHLIALGEGLAVLVKAGDVGIACTFLKEVGVNGPMLDQAGQLLAEARAVLGETADHVEVIRLIEQRAGVLIRG